MKNIISRIKEWLFYKKMTSNRSKKIPDDEYLKIKFLHKFHRELNLNNPHSFNEKLQWLKINDKNPLFKCLSDKIQVKNIVRREFGGDIVIPTICIWDSPDEIDLEKLPDKFVLKCSHDSGSVVICKNKDNFDLKKSKKILRKALKKDYFNGSREWPYKNIERKIFAERFIGNDSKAMTDYKFFCFNGEPKFLYISEGLDNHKTATMSFYDLNGKLLPYKRSDYGINEHAKMPKNFNLMIEMAKKMAVFSQAKFVRVDLYSIDNKIYFSEFTFYPCGGFIPFDPDSIDYEIGKLLKL